MPAEMPRSRILYNLAAALDRAGRPSDSAEALKRSLELEPELDASRALLGRLEPKLRTLQERLNAADALAAKGDAARALPLYAGLAAAGVDSAGLWRNVGVLRQQQGDSKGAAQAFLKALQLDPWDALLYKYAAMSLASQKHPDEAALFALVQEGARRTGDAELIGYLKKANP
jgi:tetratricopeptide (TPR) repeat protein